MAKSSRSKIKRANRAIKREKNSKKERAKLDLMVAQAKENATVADQEKKEYTVLGASEESMVVDGEVPKQLPKENTELEDLPMGVGLRTKAGHFPVWMHKRAVKRAKAVEKKKAKQKQKGKRANSRPWRR